MPTLDFESGITGWTAAYGAILSVETANPGSGTQSLRIMGNGVDRPEASITLTGFTPGALYKVEVLAAFEPGAGYSDVSNFWLWFGDIELSSNCSPDGVWRKSTATSMNRGTGSVTLTIQCTRNSSALPAVDDVFLFDSITITEVPSYLEDFESYADTTPVYSVEDWSYHPGYSDSTVTTDQAHSGTKSLHVGYIPTGSGWMFTDAAVNWFATQTPTVLCGRSFTFDAWVYVPAGQPPAKIGFLMGYNGSGDHAESVALSTLNDTWEHLTVNVTPEQLASYDNWLGPVFFGAEDMDSAYSYYVDDVVFSWDDSSLGVGPVHIDGIERYADWSEAAYNWWWGNHLGVEIDTTITHSGGQSLKIAFSAVAANPIAFQKAHVACYVWMDEWGMRNNITVEAWVYVPTGSSPITMCSADDYDTGFVVDSVTSTTFDTWEKLTLVYLLADIDTSTYGNVYFTPEDNTIDGSIVYIDDIYGSVVAPVAIDIPIEIEATGAIIGSLVASGAINIPTSISDTPLAYTGPMAASGGIDISMEITGTATLLFTPKWSAHDCTITSPAPDEYAITALGGGTTTSYIERTFTGLTPGKLHELTVHFTHLSGSQVDYYVSLNDDDNPLIQVMSIYDGAPYKTWGFAYDDTLKIRIHFNANPDLGRVFNDQTLNFVDVSLVQIDAFTSDDASYASTACAGYNTQFSGGTATHVTTHPHSGTHCWRLDITGQGSPYEGSTLGFKWNVNETHVLPPGVNVTVGAWVYVPTGNAPAALTHERGWWWYYGDPSVKQVSTTFDAWEYLEITLDSSILMWNSDTSLGTSDGSVSSTIYVDDVTVTFSGEPTPLAFSDSFETYDNLAYPAFTYYYNTPWRPLFANAIVDSANGEQRTGPLSLRCTLASDGTPIDFLTYRSCFYSGLDIVYGMWVYVPTGMEGVTLQMLDVFDGVTVHDSVNSTLNDAWEYLTVTNTFADFSSMRIVRQSMTGDSDFYVDDFTITQADSKISIPIKITGDASYEGPIAAAGTISIPLEITGDDSYTGFLYESASEVSISISTTATVSSVVLVAGATAVASMIAEPGTFAVGSGLVSVMGSTAEKIIAAGEGMFAAYTPTAVNGATATTTVRAEGGSVHMGATTLIPGDMRVAPIPIVYTGLSTVNVQSFHPNFFDAGVEPDEWVWTPTGDATSTIWYSVFSDRPLTLSVSSSGAVDAASLYIGSYQYPNWDWIMPSPTEYAIDANTPYLIRAASVTGLGAAEIVVTATPIVVYGTIGSSPVSRTPGTVTINGGGFPANALVDVALSGGTIATLRATPEGTIGPADVFLVGDLNAGTYSLVGTSGSTIAIGTLTVLSNPLPPMVYASDGPITIASGTDWMLRDPYTGTGHLSDFVFVTNPSEQGSPYAPSNITVGKTVAGAPVIWEGGARAMEWTFSGVLETEAELTALMNYRKAGRRFHLRDHRSRVWTVTFTGLDVQPLRTYPAFMVGMSPVAALHEAPWAHKYTVQALIYEGPVDVI